MLNLRQGRLRRFERQAERSAQLDLHSERRDRQPRPREIMPFQARAGGIVRHLSGNPFTPTAPATNCNCAGGTAYGDVIGTPQYPEGEGPGQLWISPSAFALPAVNTHGNAGRDMLRGPGWTDLDANLVRKFSLKERLHLEFRMEATNALNHPDFGNPDATVGSATFGQITTATNPRVAQVALRMTF